MLDFIDELTAEARIRSRPRRSSRDEVFELTPRSGARLFVVWLVVRFDHRSSEVGIDSVGYVARD